MHTYSTYAFQRIAILEWTYLELSSHQRLQKDSRTPGSLSAAWMVFDPAN